MSNFINALLFLSSTQAQRVTIHDYHLDRLCQYNKELWAHGTDTVLPAENKGKRSFQFYENDPPAFLGQEPAVFLSAPHNVRTFRYEDTRRGGVHAAETLTGAIVKLLSELTGAPAIHIDFKSDDPNYYDRVPSRTKTPGFRTYPGVGKELPYKQKIRAHVRRNRNVQVILDLHGATKVNGGNWAVDLGTGGRGREALVSSRGYRAMTSLKSHFDKQGLYVSENRVFDGCCNGQKTVTNFGAMHLGIDAMQLEIATVYRKCTTGRPKLKKLMQALVDTVVDLNKMYNSNRIGRRIDLQLPACSCNCESLSGDFCSRRNKPGRAQACDCCCQSEALALSN